jgi:hypothetical protein
MEDPFGTECFDLPIELIERGVEKDLNNLSSVVADVQLADLGAGGSLLEAAPVSNGTHSNATRSPIGTQKLLPSSSTPTPTDALEEGGFNKAI